MAKYARENLKAQKVALITMIPSMAWPEQTCLNCILRKWVAKSLLARAFVRERGNTAPS